MAKSIIFSPRAGDRAFTSAAEEEAGHEIETVAVSCCSLLMAALAALDDG